MNDKLLSVSADAKTKKGTKLGVMTGVLYLAPHTLSGHQVCPKASPECKALCLFTAGRGAMNNVYNGRMRKTKWFFEDRETFMAALVEDIARLQRKADKAKMIPAVRLNGTSDIPWEKIAVKKDGKIYNSVMEAFSDIQFYDYTKIIGRKKAISLPNYHLTFSLSENNDIEAVQAIKQGYNVAVVIRAGRKEVKPTQWGGYPAIDGDETDVRFMDEKGGHVVLLRAKGKAEKANFGFVRDKNGGFNSTNLIKKVA